MVSTLIQKGLGSGKGRTRSYQLPLPSQSSEILQIISEELQAPGLYSLSIVDGLPITVERYVEPDDLLQEKAASPTEILLRVDPLVDVEPKETPQQTYIHILFQLQTIKLTPSAIIVGSLKNFLEWMGIQRTEALHMRSFNEKTHDFSFLGVRGYVDGTLPEHKLVVLGGETGDPSLSSVRIGIQTWMGAK